MITRTERDYKRERESIEREEREMERAEKDSLWWVARGWTHVVEILNRARRVCASVSSLDSGL